MTEEQIALARRAVACKGWRWMAGMRALRDGRYWQSITDVRVSDPLHDGGYPGFFPDLEDPSTLGCVLALVREALDSPRVHVLYVEGLYRWECADNRTVHGVGATEAEALIETLEYAP